MTNFLIIFVALVGGYLLRKTGKVQASSAAGVNTWLINIAMLGLGIPLSLLTSFGWWYVLSLWV